ncbi:hypothetical protein [Micromonospora sp. KC723]|uniref:hypothetical protein n=1 Tax=Micromonospora sp. KC723 TaxID=2530381 RepID=UPI001042EF18|nr:hypothetical protein [Micromonospora sp. KC723]TDB70274.1 hypothetical protein E1165_26250 [Micromonospora sp. KC723]
MTVIEKPPVLGLGTRPPAPEWGRLADNRPYAGRALWATPAAAGAPALSGALAVTLNAPPPGRRGRLAPPGPTAGPVRTPATAAAAAAGQR